MDGILGDFGGFTIWVRGGGDLGFGIWEGKPTDARGKREGCRARRGKLRLRLKY